MCVLILPPVFYLLVVILLVAISAPGAISSTPITTVLVEGNVIVVLVGFMIAISVIIPAWPPGCDGEFVGCITVLQVTLPIVLVIAD